MSQVQVITGQERRRRWNDERKRALVAEAFAPGAVVLDVARRADVSASLLYRWRREFGTASKGFAEVIVAPLAPASPGAVEVGVIEIEFGDRSRVRIPATVSAELASAIVRALVGR